MPTNTPARVGGDISHEAYLRYLEDKGERWRDSGDGATDMAVSAADWERHTPAQRREAVAMHSGAYGGFTFGDDDPLAQQFIAQFGRYPTGYRTELSNKPISGYIVSENAPSGADYNNWEGSAIDPSRVFRDPNTGMYVWEAGNIKPEVIVGLQDRDAQSYNQHALMMAAAFGGLAGGHAMLSNGLLGGAGDAAGTGWAQGGGFGAGGISPETAAGAGGMGSGATSAAAGAAGATPAAGAAGSGSVGFTGPFAPGMEGAGLIDDFLINNGMSGLAGGPLTAALGGNLGAAGSGLLSAALANPLQAAGLLYSASGLFGGGNNSNNSNNSGGANTPAAGLLDANKFQRPQWTPNQNTLAQLQQLYGGNYGR